jgi:DNA-binding FadR family transcriptional regulator
VTESRRLYRQIADQLTAAIAAGAYPVGSRLPSERELAERLGVGRPSVREALIALEVEGLVEVRAGSGVWVRAQPAGERAPRPVPPGPFDVIRARRLLEGEVCRIAAKSASDAQLAAIGDAVDAMSRGASDDPAWIDLDRRFHLRIAEATGNAALVLLVATLWEQRTDPLFRQLEAHFQRHNTWQRAVAEHSAIYHALAARDADLAAKLMRLHMDNAEERLSSSNLGQAADAAKAA